MTDELEFAYARLSTIASDDPLVQLKSGHHEAIVDAVAAIGVHDGFHVAESFPWPYSDTLPDMLRQLAMQSGFRFREVSLEGDWWRREGSSLLVWNSRTNQPAAAIWKTRRYYLQDVATGQFECMDQGLAADVYFTGFQLYPGLPKDSSFMTLAAFAVQGSFASLRMIFAASVLAVLAGLIVPIATGVVVSTAIPDGRLPLLSQMAILIGGGALGVFALGVTRTLLTIRLETLVNTRLQGAIWDRVLRLPSGFFRKFESGDLVRRILAIDQSRQLLTGPVIGAILTGLFSIVSFILMLVYDLRLAVFGVCFALVALGTLLLLAWRQLRHQLAYQTLKGRVTSQTLDLLAGAEKLKLAAAEERGFAQWSVLFSGQQHMLWRIGRIRVHQMTFLSIVGSVGILGTILVAGLRAEPISLAAFAAFNAAFGQFVAAISSFGLALGTFAMVVPLLQRAAPVLGAEPEQTDVAKDPGQLSGQISFNNVSFRYVEDGPLVLDRINFTVEPGEFVALVGQSGAGKSTILRLLLGFEKPETGSVFYGGSSLSSLDLRLVRQQIGTVLQSADVLPGSIYQNIAGGRMVPDEDVMEAARRAAFADDIESFPMGLDTFVSEGGQTLSGGQRQRLTIAQALLGNPSIIFFDEATSALDNHMQSILKQSIDDMDITRLVIAHRLSTIRDADKILVLENGRIVETGTYEELMKNKASFYALAKPQLI